MRHIATINSIITDALDFGYPVKFGTYTGDETTYFVFNYSSFGTDFSDDAPNHERVLAQVHFYCPHGINCLNVIKQTKQKLFAAGFTWPNVTPADDDISQHFVFECEAARGVELSG